VNQPRNPLRFNAGFMLSQSVGSTRDINFDIGEIRLSDDVVVTGLNGKARLGRTQQGILLQGTFNAQVTCECMRCLTNFERPLTTQFDELFAFDRRLATEVELILPEDANIDLQPLLQEYLLIEIPISALCKVDCKGLCLECGEDLNTKICEHQKEYNKGRVSIG
jgi:uncharacterized protein